jgi:hypothetical protein
MLIIWSPEIRINNLQIRQKCLKIRLTSPLFRHSDQRPQNRAHSAKLLLIERLVNAHPQADCVMIPASPALAPPGSLIALRFVLLPYCS